MTYCTVSIYKKKTNFFYRRLRFRANAILVAFDLPARRTSGKRV